MSKTIKLPVYNMVIELDGEGGGTIASDLDDDTEISGSGYAVVATSTLESLVLAHAIAGVDVGSPAYLEGIETTVDFITNRFT